MKYKIIDVEGIGPVYAEKLLAAGIVDTDILLEKCAKPAGRKQRRHQSERYAPSGFLLSQISQHDHHAGKRKQQRCQLILGNDTLCQIRYLSLLRQIGIC